MSKKQATRSQKALYNTIAGFSEEIADVVVTMIISRLVITGYGSQYNGLTSSISQFLTCVSLMRAGIGGATKVALYKPLAEGDYIKVSQVINQTQKWLNKVAIAFMIFLVGFSVVYPLWINTEFDFFFASSLILLTGLTTIVQYFFGLKYKMLLYADQKQYVVAAMGIVLLIINATLSIIMLNAQLDYRLVKAKGVLVFMIKPIFYYFYCGKRYHLNSKIQPDTDLIKQRWDSLGHEVANFVNNNTDVMVLTVFTSLGMVSVYTVHNYVMGGIRKVVTNFVNGFGAAFGNMYAKNEIDLMHENLGIFEIIVFSLASVVYSVTAVMICSFCLIFTQGAKYTGYEVSYYQPLFAAIIVGAGAFSCFRIPYETVTKAVGHYKQTRNGAFGEAIINIVISVAAVIKFGLAGVAFGTIVAAIYRTIQFTVYMSKNILHRSLWKSIKHILVALGIGAATYLISLTYMPAPDAIPNYFVWAIYAVITTLIAIALTVATDFLLFNTDTKNFMKKGTSILKGNKHKKKKNRKKSVQQETNETELEDVDDVIEMISDNLEEKSMKKEERNF